MSSPRAETLDTTTERPAIVIAKPIVLPASERGEDLQLRVSAPAGGENLPTVFFSHGFGESMNGYEPLADFWAASGFVVVQPTHLDSQTLAVPPTDPRAPLIWRFRIEDLRQAIDGLDQIEAAVPGLAGRIDREQIAVAGHSYGATSASALLGARVLDPDGLPGEDFTDPRIKAGAFLSLTGAGGDHLTPFAVENFPFIRPDFDGMTRPALIVAGGEDDSPLTTRGPDWFTDAYRLSPGKKSLVVLAGADHFLGGIDGYEVAHPGEPSDPRRHDQVELVQHLTTAFLRSALGIEGASWVEVSRQVGGNELVAEIKSK